MLLWAFSASKGVSLPHGSRPGSLKPAIAAARLGGGIFPEESMELVLIAV